MTGPISSTRQGTAPLRAAAPPKPPVSASTGTGPLAKPQPSKLVTEAERGADNLWSALGAAFGAITAPAQALFDVLTGGLTPQTRQALDAQRLGVGDLQGAALAFAPMLLGFNPVGQIMGAAALAFLNQARSLDDLTRTPQNEARAGRAVVDQLVGALFPSPADAALRQGASELLVNGYLGAATGAQLGPKGLTALGDGLGARREFIGQFMQGGLAPMLDGMIRAVQVAASADRPTVAGVNEAAQRALPQGMRRYEGGFAAGTKGDFSAGFDDPLGGSGSVSGDARAAHAGGLYAQGRAGRTKDGVMAEGALGAAYEARAEANLHGRYALGDAVELSLDGHVDAGVLAKAELAGSARLGKDGLHAAGYVGAEVKADANATLDSSTSLFGGAIAQVSHTEGHATAEASAVAAGRANVGFDKNGNFELDLGFDAHASASVEAKAKHESSFNLFGFKLGVEGYASAQAGAEAGVNGWLSFKNGELRLGGGLGAAVGVGAEVGGGIVIGLPPWAQDAVSGIARAGQALGDVFGSLFGGGAPQPA